MCVKFTEYLILVITMCPCEKLFASLPKAEIVICKGFIDKFGHFFHKNLIHKINVIFNVCCQLRNLRRVSLNINIRLILFQHLVFVHNFAIVAVVQNYVHGQGEVIG